MGGLVGETAIEVRLVDIPGEWLDDGVDSLASTINRGVVGCSAEHLTDFAGILLYPPPPPRIVFPVYSGEDYAWDLPDRTVHFPSRVGEAGFYILVLNLLTTGILGMMLHHCKHRRKLKEFNTELTNRMAAADAYIRKHSYLFYRQCIIWRYQWFTKKPFSNIRGALPPELVIAAELSFTVMEGKALVAKDGAGFFNLRPNTMSDPYVVVRIGRRKIAQCPVIYKTLNPKWNLEFQYAVESRDFKPDGHLTFAIMDKDADSFDDPMGEVRIPFSTLFAGNETEDCELLVEQGGQLVRIHAQRQVADVELPLALQAADERVLDSGGYGVDFELL